MTDDPAAKKTRGRPRLYPGTEKRPTLTFRVRGNTHQLLQASAEANERSISEEIEARVSASFSKNGPAQYIEGKYNDLIEYIGGKENIWPCFVMMLTLKEAINHANTTHPSDVSWLIDKNKQLEVEVYMREKTSETINSITLSNGRLIDVNARLFTLIDSLMQDTNDKRMQNTQTQTITD